MAPGISTVRLPSLLDVSKHLGSGNHSQRKTSDAVCRRFTRSLA